jgi:hypothetical protein
MTDQIQKPKSIHDQLSENVNPGEAPAIPTSALNQPIRPAVVAPPPSHTAGKTAGQTPAPVFANTTLLEKLVELMLQKEGREAAKDQIIVNAERTRQVQRDRNSKDKDSKILLKQARCKHLKGGKKGPKNQNLDYAVGRHTFIDALTYIRCLVCGMRWYPQDTVEYLLRNGKKISNHTHAGWREAYKFTEQSTNTPTMSEMLVTTMAKANPGAFLQATDAAGLDTTYQIRDLEGNLVSDVQL